MPTFPIPIFVACVLGFASLRLWQQRGKADPLVLLLKLCAVQSLIIALSQHYGVVGMRIVQPFVASLIPAAAWLAYQYRISRTHIVHALGPLTTTAALVVSPQFLDVLIPALFVLYGTMILISARTGADARPDTLLASGDLPTQIWLIIGVALIASALSDVLIVATQIAGYPELRPWIISLFSVGNLMVIGALGLSPHLQTIVEEEPEKVPAQQVADTELWEHLQTFMKTQRPYLDPDLTLSRLARKLGVSAKSLSATINLTTGENVSRFINKARIVAAQDLMLKGESVTNAMFLSGFNTKSNFNREFLRVVGISPKTWLNQPGQTYQDT